MKHTRSEIKKGLRDLQGRSIVRGGKLPFDWGGQNSSAPKNVEEAYENMKLVLGDRFRNEVEFEEKKLNDRLERVKFRK